MGIKTNEIVWEVIMEPEEIPIHGNVMASGDAAFDKECEDDIQAQIDGGNDWAWCSVTIRGTYRGILKAESTLGGCSYASEADFMSDSGYVGGMKMDVIDELNTQLDKLTAE